MRDRQLVHLAAALLMAAALAGAGQAAPQERGWGWALWNLHGSFGILDSGRKDVDYEELRGRKLDRKMLELLQKY